MKRLIVLMLLVSTAANAETNYEKCKKGYTDYCEVKRGASPYSGHGH